MYKKEIEIWKHSNEFFLYKDSISLKNKKNALNDTEIVAKKIIKKFDFFRNEKL